jgi:hypothetical protein
MVLYQMDSQHLFEVEGLVATLSLTVVRLDNPFLLTSWDDAIDFLEELFLVGSRLSQISS